MYIENLVKQLSPSGARVLMALIQQYPLAGTCIYSDTRAVLPWLTGMRSYTKKSVLRKVCRKIFLCYEFQIGILFGFDILFGFKFTKRSFKLYVIN